MVNWEYAMFTLLLCHNEHDTLLQYNGLIKQSYTKILVSWMTGGYVANQLLPPSPPAPLRRMVEELNWISSYGWPMATHVIMPRCSLVCVKWGKVIERKFMLWSVERKEPSTLLSTTPFKSLIASCLSVPKPSALYQNYQHQAQYPNEPWSMTAIEEDSQQRKPQSIIFHLLSIWINLFHVANIGQTIILAYRRA